MNSNFHTILKNITVEPVIIFYLLSVGFNQVSRPNLLLQKACLTKLNFTADVCENISDNDDVKDEIQKVVTDYESNVNYAAFAPRILFALLAGHWSDNHGRKYIIGIPLFGQV